MHGKADGLSKLSDDLLRLSGDGQREVVHVHLGEHNVSPSGLHSSDGNQHKDSELRSSETRSSRYPSIDSDKPGVHSINLYGPTKPIGGNAELEDGHGITIFSSCFEQHAVRHRLQGLDQAE